MPSYLFLPYVPVVFFILTHTVIHPAHMTTTIIPTTAPTVPTTYGSICVQSSNLLLRTPIYYHGQFFIKHVQE